MNNVAKKPGLKPIEFSVDSALLKELGERLVGKAHIALAELVKNSYDADAAKVEITFSKDRIEIRDNGHGMTFEEFKKFWMRVGSPHKQKTLLSRKLKRPVTGSKGVGRLAVQFLADNLQLITVADSENAKEIVAEVDWKDAVKARELTKATALWQQRKSQTIFPENKKHGTAIILSGLHQIWVAEDLENLAREIWVLQPPFKRQIENSGSDAQSFNVEVLAPNETAVSLFQEQMNQGLNQWIAKISGRLIRSRGEVPYVDIVVEFNDGYKDSYMYKIFDCRIYEVEFEIRVFRLQGRQKGGIKVGQARDYLDKFGGVHVYDAGFHLPYYGPDTDWLGIERDHAARLTRSDLLPDELQVTRGLQFLPTQRRIFGVVNINTGKERTNTIGKNSLGKTKTNLNIPGQDTEAQIKEDDFLKIQVSRDRLVDNKAFHDLQKVVRFALDFYSVQTQRRNQTDKNTGIKTIPLQERFEKISEVLDYYETKIPSEIFSDLKRHLREAAEETETDAQNMLKRTRLLGALATAGISSLSYQHEIDKQLLLLEEVVKDLSFLQIKDNKANAKVSEISETISNWLMRARSLRNLFSFMMDEENRTIVQSFKARNIISQIVKQMGILLRSSSIDLSELSSSLFLPEGSYAEWSSIFQNVLLNATNAMLDSKDKQIAITSLTRGKKQIIQIKDMGIGVDLKTANELFDPFVRKIDLSAANRALGLGGTGLGLTIVRMLATNLNCKVSFVDPGEDYITAFQLEWNET